MKKAFTLYKSLFSSYYIENIIVNRYISLNSFFKYTFYIFKEILYYSLLQINKVNFSIDDLTILNPESFNKFSSFPLA